MPASRADIAINIIRRIGLWACCLILAVTLFSLPFGAGFAVVFRVTMTFALPVWFLYLPLIVAFKDVEKRRIWIILVSGILIGPTALALWCLILQLRGGDAYTIWHGDPLAPSTGACMIFASVVGVLATAIYGTSLRVLYRRSAVAKD
jgi:hypothetical protein